MSTLSTVSVDFSASTSKFTQGLADMSKKTKSWSAATKKDMGDVTSAATKMANALKSVFAALSVTLVVAKFASVTKEVMALADEAEKVGASAEQFTLLSYAAQKNGATIADVKIAYKELQKSITEANNENKETIENFRKLGLSYIWLSTLNPDQRFLQVASALSKVTDENKKAALGTAILGKAYTELAPLLSKGAAGIQGFGQGGRQSGVVLSEKDIASIDKMGKGFEELGNIIKGQFLAVLLQAVPLLNSIADFSKLIIANWKSIGIAIGIALAPSLIEKFVSVGATVWRSFVAMMQISTLKSVNAAIGAYSAALGPGIRKAIAETEWGAVTVVSAAFAKISDKITALFFGLKAIGVGFFATWGIALGGFISALGVGFQLVEKMANAMAYIMEHTPGNTWKKEAAWLRDYAKIAAEDYKKMTEYIPKLIESLKTPMGPTDEDIEKQKAFYTERNKLEKEAAMAAADLRDEMWRKVNPKALLNFTAPKFESSNENFSGALGGFGSKDVLLRVQATNYNLSNTSKIVSDISDGFVTAGEKQLDFMTGVKAMTFSITSGQADQERAQNLKNKKYTEEYNRIQQIGKGLRDSTMTAREVYRKQVEDIEAAVEMTDEYGEALITAEQSTRALEAAQIQLWESSNSWVNNVRDSINEMTDGMAKAIVNGEGLSSVFQNLAKDILATILKTLILQGLLAAIGLVNPVAGAAFTKMMNLPGRASGGKVNAGSAYMVGENGQEAFVPNSNGYIVPNNMLGGGGGTVIQNISIQTGTAQTVRNEIMGLLPQIKAQAVLAVAETKNRGGSYARAMA